MVLPSITPEVYDLPEGAVDGVSDADSAIAWQPARRRARRAAAPACAAADVASEGCTHKGDGGVFTWMWKQLARTFAR